MRDTTYRQEFRVRGPTVFLLRPTARFSGEPQVITYLLLLSCSGISVYLNIPFRVYEPTKD